MAQKKNFKNGRDLKVDALVYYQKKESELSSVWVVGKVDQVVRGRDGIIRKVIVKYTNFKENFSRLTERSARKLIRIWSADDPELQADLLKVQARIDQLQGHLGQQLQGHPGHQLRGHLGQGDAGDNDNDALVLQDGASSKPTQPHPCYPDVLPVEKCQCCCLAHCRVTFHNIYGSKAHHQPPSVLTGFEMAAQDFKDCKEQDHSMGEDKVDEPDNITALIMSVGVDLS